MSTTNVNYLLTVQTAGAQKALGGVGKQLGGIKNLLAGFAPALAAGAVVAGITEIINISKGFEKSMSNVKALTGATGEQFEMLSQQAKDLGQTTTFSASQASDAMGFLAQAGFDTNQILSALPSTLSLAAAGSIDLATAADLASNVLSGYGFEANQLAAVSDVMAKTFTTSNTDLTQLAEAFKEAAPIASGLGLQFTEVSAAIGILANSGIQGSKAGTALKNAFTRLAAPTNAIQSTLDRLGVSVKDSDGSMRSLTDIVGQLEEAGADTTDIMKIFGRIAGGSMIKLLDAGAEGISEYEETLRKAGGTADEIARVKLDNLEGSLTLLSSAWEGLVLSFEDGSGFMNTVLRAVIDDIAKGFQMLSGQLATTRDQFSFLGTVMQLIKINISILMIPLKLILIPFKVLFSILGRIANALGLASGEMGTFGEVMTQAFIIFQRLPDIINIVLDQVTEGLKTMIDLFGAVGDIIAGVFTFDPAQIKKGISAGFETIQRAIKDVTDIGGKVSQTLQVEAAKESDQLGVESLLTGQAGGGAGAAGSASVAGLSTAGNLGADVSGAKGSKLTNINITINKLVEELNVKTTNLTEGAGEIRDIISRELLRAVNDVNIQAG